MTIIGGLHFKNSTFFSEHYGYSGIKLIVDNIKESWSDEKNLNAKLSMAMGTYFSGLSIGLVDVNLAHAMSHPISAYYGVQHGLAVLLCTFQSIRFNASHLKEKYSRVAKIMGYDNGGARQVIDELLSWVNLFNIDIKMKNYGISQNSIEKFADDALMIGAIDTNIRKINKNQLIDMYLKIYDGIVD